MIALVLGLLAQSAANPVPAARVMACYMQEDDLSRHDPANPNAAHLVGHKYLIAWKYVPLTTFGISKAPMETHDPHKFLNSNSFGEQTYNAGGVGFFAGEPDKELVTIAVMPDQTPAGLHKAQLIHTSNKKVVGMAFGYCEPDERAADEAFAFWKSQPESLP